MLTYIIYFLLADMVFSAPFYLQNLLDEDRYHGYPINDPDGFLSSLMLVSCAFEVEVSVFFLTF